MEGTQKTSLEMLKRKLDLKGKYVDYSSIRKAVSLSTIIGSLSLKVSQPNKRNESRCACPKCKKPSAFTFNTETNRFNCFHKDCGFCGGGVIDFTSKLLGITTKEASHLIAYVYGVEPYGIEKSKK